VTRYAWVAARRAEGFPTRLACWVARVTRSGFYAWAERYLSRPNFRSARTTRQRIFAAVVQPMDGVVIESLISDVHPGMERWVCGKFFDREADGLSGGPKTSISDRPSTALAAFHE